MQDTKLTLVALVNPLNNMVFHVAQTKFGDNLVMCEEFFVDNASKEKEHYKVNQTYPFTRINPIIRQIIDAGEIPIAKRIDTRKFNYLKARAIVNSYYNLMDNLLE